jgi:hypothetical protein
MAEECPECGNPVRPSTAVCPECGIELDEPEPGYGEIGGPSVLNTYVRGVEPDPAYLAAPQDERDAYDRAEAEALGLPEEGTQP